jgi:REP element-mobilizing transposase RayT
LCCDSRNESTLCVEPIGQAILDAARHYEGTNKWFVHTMLLMPDHLLAIVCLPSDTPLTGQIAAFKKFTSRNAGIEWQRGFFEHRLRGDESLDEKVHYIAMNPVRKGLVTKAAEWPWVYKPLHDGPDGRLGEASLP